MSLIDKNETNQNAHGGSELMSERLNDLFASHDMSQFQVIVSRFRGLNPNKEYHLFYSHDLPTDPESQRVFLDNQLVRQLDAIVFVSYHQMESFLYTYPLLRNRRRKCFVVRNAFDLNALPKLIKPNHIHNRLIYTSTPQRGLNLLLDAFKRVKKDVADLQLEVFSTFGLYGWKEKDKEFSNLFNELDSTDGVIRHKDAVSNLEIHNALSNASIFAYPSIWEETSCLCLIEAMAEGLICVTSDFGALPETGAGFPMMYSGTGITGVGHLTTDQFLPIMREESERFELVLRRALELQGELNTSTQVKYATKTFGLDAFYHSWLDIFHWVSENGHKN